MEESPNRAEAERLLRIAEKLLQGKDLSGSRDFAILAQETEPLLEGSDQILAVTDVLLCAEKRINNHHDWYSILQVERRSDDLETIKRQYRRLALLLHPDKNKFAYADAAFKLVADAWAVLSDPTKKSPYDNELGLFSKVDLVAKNQSQRAQNSQFRPPSSSQHGQVEDYHNSQKLPVRRGSGLGTNNSDSESRMSSFWTACPYCYNLHQYPRVYEECCLRCQNCQRAFHAARIPSLPPLVPGKEAYYCCWGFFPLGFVADPEDGGGGKKSSSEFPNWMPPIFPGGGAAPSPPSAVPNGGAGGGEGFVDVSSRNATPAPAPAPTRAPAPAGSLPRKRGRPRKNVQA